MDQDIDNDTDFNWWVNLVLNKRLRIIPLVKKRDARYLKKTHQFGIEVPKSAVHVYALDKTNNNTLWADAITKEMKDMSPAFNKLNNGNILPIGYQRVNCHISFDVNMEDFRNKARLTRHRASSLHNLCKISVEGDSQD